MSHEHDPSQRPGLKEGGRIRGVPQEEHLALCHRCVEQIGREWSAFLTRRSERLAPHPLIGEATEKVTESILEDLLSAVLDWPLSSFSPQVEHADIVLTDLGIKRLIIEAKRPGSLSWHRGAVDRALEQALRYAAAQRVKCVAVSDGHMLYAADVVEGGKQDRIFVSLEGTAPPVDLWWLSRAGIYRSREVPAGELLRLLPEQPIPSQATETSEGPHALLHPKYKLPARCFAYVGNHSEPHTWKLPYLLNDGTADPKRLPKAIQAILTNYRGARVSGIPEEAIPAVLSRLATAAAPRGAVAAQPFSLWRAPCAPLPLPTRRSGYGQTRARRPPSVLSLRESA